MEDPRDAAEDWREIGGREVEPDELDLSGDVGESRFLTGAQVVDDPHLSTGAQERARQMRANETGATGDQVEDALAHPRDRRRPAVLSHRSRVGLARTITIGMTIARWRNRVPTLPSTRLRIIRMPMAYRASTPIGRT